MKLIAYAALLAASITQAAAPNEAKDKRRDSGYKVDFSKKKEKGSDAGDLSNALRQPLWELDTDEDGSSGKGRKGKRRGGRGGRQGKLDMYTGWKLTGGTDSETVL
mmetsp:Transcript_1026/g.1399  ORF Transcript_1026/g.1399 Transcript_1026/m.1399 type:complete len:106 (+) Transcript_1026:11-328(+)|eukprot:CAMPEP_0170465970 /NCGR_PEP_ID=MMETSP0123-20130129/10116_1 /TAXON_ID=182087 /ORGANISM="Favella ehrenbergii, Strain Fehren 1" /LENGTH=105 /DNA_ID=CAMNT_0010732003 /DNA_START=49 /DNA_END=366 /DNA_ORIENTATION=-